MAGARGGSGVFGPSSVGIEVHSSGSRNDVGVDVGVGRDTCSGCQAVLKAMISEILGATFGVLDHAWALLAAFRLAMRGNTFQLQNRVLNGMVGQC